ncbi:malignant T-cell-amplified sequence 1 homolog isoform X2 [Drosophila pseudoobscura]|uniref:Malignant T-cell-amplified sequence 1 homolog isoform X2 n=1 Tax=Drosophila pseudoobscura pseudoobscura TaxID=46245 RepID=B5DMW8_DROPS|nr:malignant T-cell-amplified sequence 1 homolog isoform X2 [Drosophila pseudoobscura]
MASAAALPGIKNFSKMFKKFEEKDSISSIQQLKSSVQKGIRAKLLEAYPKLETHIDLILPKKDSYRIAKCHDHIELLLNGAGEQVFFRHRDGPWMPTLRLLHKFPYFVTMEQVDKGAIRFVLSGANVMCPGLTSPGACMTPAEKNTVVAIMAEGKEHALAIGLLTLSTEEILAKNKGIGIETYHFLNDGLWKSKPVK